MTILRTISSKSNIFQRAYKSLSTVCLDRSYSLRDIKTEYKDAQDLFVTNGQAHDFFKRTLNLTNYIESQGDTSASKLLINELSKLAIACGFKGEAEKLLYRAIANCRESNDSLHELARIIDLEKLYSSGYSKQKNYKVLRMKKDCCKRVLADYNESKRNFISINKAPTPIECVVAHLAYTYARIGELLGNKNAVDAIRALNKSRTINLQLGRYRAADSAKYTIRDIQEYLKSKYW